MVSLPSQAGAARAGRPFCEASQRWAEMTRLPQRFEVETVLGARTHLASRPEQLLMALSPLKSEQGNFATVKVYSGRLDTFISIEAAKRWFDGRNGGLEQRMIVEYLRVPAGALDRFMERLSRREHGSARDAGTKHARSKRAAKRSMKKTAKAS